MGSENCAPAPTLKPIVLVPEPHSIWSCGAKPFVAGASGTGIVNDASPSSVTEKSTGVEPTMLCTGEKRSATGEQVIPARAGVEARSRAAQD